MDDSNNMVFLLLANIFVSLELLLLIPSINCITCFKDAAVADLDDYCSMSSSVTNNNNSNTILLGRGVKEILISLTLSKIWTVGFLLRLFQGYCGGFSFRPNSFGGPLGVNLTGLIDSLDMTGVVRKKSNELNKFWWFLSPFAPELWLTMTALTLFTGFVFWIIERRNEDGPTVVESLLFFVQRSKPRNILTYIVLVPWLLLILILTSTYTSVLTSMVTSSETKPSCLDLENFKIKSASVGCDVDSFIFPYLVNDLGFRRKNIKNISESSFDDYEKTLSSGNTKAAFFSPPNADHFLAKYRRGFIALEPSHHPYGSTIVLRPRGSSVSDCSKIDDTTRIRIGIRTFSGLFILSGGVSALAMLITVIRELIERWESFIRRMLIGRGLRLWLTTLFSQNHMRNELQLARI